MAECEDCKKTESEDWYCEECVTRYLEQGNNRVEISMGLNAKLRKRNREQKQQIKQARLSAPKECARLARIVACRRGLSHEDYAEEVEGEIQSLIDKETTDGV